MKMLVSTGHNQSRRARRREAAGARATTRARPSRGGFTLMEMLIAVVTISATAAIAVPPLAWASEYFVLRGAVDEFRAAHNLARAIAVRSNRVGQLRIEPDSGVFWVQVDTSFAGTGVLDTIGRVVRLSDLKISVTSTRSTLCFDARGIATAMGACDATQSANLIFTRGSEADTLWRSELGMLAR